MTMSTNETLEKTVREKPFLQHVLDLRLVMRAVAFALVAALVIWLLVGPASAGFMLLLVFFASWFVLARVDYDRRRESEPVDEQGGQGEGQPAGAS
jgi:Flp pilus assembly protein TadB